MSRFLKSLETAQPYLDMDEHYRHYPLRPEELMDEDVARINKNMHRTGNNNNNNTGLVADPYPEPIDESKPLTLGGIDQDFLMSYALNNKPPVVNSNNNNNVNRSNKR